MSPAMLVPASPLADTPCELRLMSWALIAPLAETTIAIARTPASDAPAAMRLLREVPPVPGVRVTRLPIPQTMHGGLAEVNNRARFRVSRSFRHTSAHSSRQPFDWEEPE